MIQIYLNYIKNVHNLFIYQYLVYFPFILTMAFHRSDMLSKHFSINS